MSAKEPRIIKCTIGEFPRPKPEGLFDKMPLVKVQFDNGEEKELFEFYPDELSFTENEFIGLTKEEGRQLKFEKDLQYLQS